MTIASKTVLVQMRFIRAGSPFCDIGANPAIVANGNMDFVRNGNTFFGVSNVETPPVYPSNAFPIRKGAPFNDNIGNSSINASEFDYVRLGAPYWHTFGGTPPVTYNATQFFLLF